MSKSDEANVRQYSEIENHKNGEAINPRWDLAGDLSLSERRQVLRDLNERQIRQ